MLLLSASRAVIRKNGLRPRDELRLIARKRPNGVDTNSVLPPRFSQLESQVLSEFDFPLISTHDAGAQRSRF